MATTALSINGTPGIPQTFLAKTAVVDLGIDIELTLSIKRSVGMTAAIARSVNMTTAINRTITGDYPLTGD